MKIASRVWALLIFCAVSYQVEAQADSSQHTNPVKPETLTPDKIDTIWVSKERTTIVVFNTPVTTMDIGTRDFGGQIDATTVLLKPIGKGELTPTSIYIRHGEGFYSGTIAYKPTLDPSLYMLDFSKAKKAQEIINENRAITTESESLERQEIARRLGFVEAAKDRIKQSADIKDKIIFSVSEMMYDENRYYFKLLVSNRSSTTYEIDFMEFTFVAPGGKGKNDAITPGKIVGDNGIKQVGSKEIKYLCYAVNRHDLPSDGKLLISLRERDGSRRMDLTLEYKHLGQARTF